MNVEEEAVSTLLMGQRLYRFIDLVSTYTNTRRFHRSCGLGWVCVDGPKFKNNF